MTDFDNKELNFRASQTSVVDYDQQTKENIPQSNSSTNGMPLFELLTIDSLFDEDASKSSVVKNDTDYEAQSKKVLPLVTVFSPLVYNDVDSDELYDDFDPMNALIFKNSPVTEQHSQQAKTHRGVKRKYRDPDDCSQKHKKSIGALRDDEAQFIESVIVEEYCAKMKRSKPDTSQTTAWRLGPAKYWFDLIEVPESGDGFDYGFELAHELEEEDESYSFDNIDEDAFLMVSQLHWEDDIIWDVDDTTPDKQKVTNFQVRDWKLTQTNKSLVLHEERSKIIESEDGTLYSNFPMENKELVYGLWESEIIWDAKAMKKILQPKILEIDPSDEDIILAVPEDSDQILSCESAKEQSKTRTGSHTSNVKSMLSKTGVTGASDDEETSAIELCNLDPFNISNDMYYMPKSADKLTELDHQQHLPHSIPVLQLHPQLIPTYIGPKRLRKFHRLPLKRYLRGRLAQSGPHPVLSLTKYIHKKEKLRRESLEAGELFFARTFEDLSGRDGNIVLVEFSEEFPPLMNFIGMRSKIKNYYKRKIGKDTGPPEFKYGETAYPQNGLFLGNLAPGQSLQTLENNMYRVPIYEHKVNDTDFLVIRTRNQYYIREIDALYVAGQQCPLQEVPPPKSKKVSDFMRNFLQVFAYKTFSKTHPPKIHKDELKKAFPTLKPTFIKRHLSLFADYISKKGDPDCFNWVLKPTFRLPLEDEIRLLVSPEQCCAYFSMVAAHQRLKDAGYGDKSTFVLQDNDANDREMQTRLDDEVKAAPWNTTRAYIDAVDGKCCLQLIGPADPTGCGDAFSYVRVPLKSVFKPDENVELKPKKITGTEADLRILSVKGAETILRNYGVSVQDIKKLTRWEMIDAVRTLSTIREDRGEEGFAKFSRTKRFTISGIQQRYKEECQRIFDRQNNVLASSDVLSSEDEDEDANEGIEEVERIAESIENLLNSKGKSGALLEFEREEREREELLRMLADDAPVKNKPKDSKKDEPKVDTNTSRTLRIHRTFRNADGSEYTRTELVRDPAVIDAYLMIRSTKDDAFIKQYAYVDEEVERQKKTIESQLKNIKMREKRQEKIEKKLSTVATGGKAKCEKKDLTDGSDQKFVKVNGTKVKFSMKLINRAEKAKHENTPKKRKRSSGDEQDYSKHCQRPAGTNRQRSDPVVLLSTIFEEILTVVRGHKEFQPFAFPVNTKILHDYRRIIDRPMDLQTMLDNIRQKKYQNRRDFLGDILQIKENSVRYNGKSSPLSDLAQKMLNLCVKLVAEKEDKIIRLENAIAPPVDENDQEAFSDIIGSVVKVVKSMPEAVPFFKPVNKNLPGSKDYYNIVKNPMDLETISKKIATHKYRRRAEVMDDFRLIVSNCILYNGKNSLMKNKAEVLLKTAEKHFDGLTDQILHLEISIGSAQERAMRQADIDTSWMYEVDDSAVVESKSPVNLSEDEFTETATDTGCSKPSAKNRFANKFATTTLNLSDDDSEDSCTDTNGIKINYQSTMLPTIHEKSVLEEDLEVSSDDDL